MLRFLGRSDNPPKGLEIHGPLVTVRLLPDPELATARPATSVEAMLMIDTGASRTVIEETTIQKLGMPPLRYMPITGVSQQADLCAVYRMAIEIQMVDEHDKPGAAIMVTDVAGVPSPSLPEKHVGLLGRDFLQYVRLIYDGPKGEFEVVDYLDKETKETL